MTLIRDGQDEKNIPAKAQNYEEDEAHATKDFGVHILAVRADDPGTGLGADGDYASLVVDETGHLHVRDNFGGAFYAKNVTTADAEARIEASAKLLRHCVIKNMHATYEAEIGESGAAFVALDPGKEMELFDINLFTVYVKSQTSTEHAELDIWGSEV